jgi:hypothetical protein
LDFKLSPVIPEEDVTDLTPITSQTQIITINFQQMKKKILALIAASVFATSGCNEDILDVKNQSAYDEATYFTSASTFDEGIIAIYSGLLMPGLYSRDAYFIFDLLGHDATNNVFLLGDLAQLQDYSFGSSQPQLQSLWRNLYRMVLRSNLILDKIQTWNPTLQADLDRKQQFIGEARFLRGYSYFMLVSLWGRVPLRLDYKTAQENVPRAAVADVWKAVEDDFKAAAEALPVSFTGANLGRATQGAAVAMLGKSYLYQKKYAETQQEFVKLLSAPYNYKLSESFDALFTATGVSNGAPVASNMTNPEIILQVPHGKWEGWGTGNAFYMFGGQEAWGGKATHSGRAQEYGWNDWNNVFVSDALVNAFKYQTEAGTPYIDPRAKLTFYGDAASGGDVTYCDACSGGPKPYPFGSTNTIRYGWRKYGMYEVAEKSGIPQSDINTILIRLADVKLMLAEAYIFQNNLTAALPHINDVRQRVGAFQYTTLGNQQTAFRILQRERQLELAGEQTRWFDLNRWGVARQVLNAEKQVQLGKQPFEEKHSLLPIPLLERSSNSAVNTDVANEWN